MAGCVLFSQVLIVLGILLFVEVQGSCFVGQLMAEMTVSGRFRYYCEYTQGGHVTRLLPGSNMALLDDCMDCKCTLDGLECCGIGHASGAIGHPPDCKILLDGCQPLIVKVNNESLDCFSGATINVATMSIKVPHPDNVYMANRFIKTTKSENSMTSPTTSSPDTPTTTSSTAASPNPSANPSSTSPSPSISATASPKMSSSMTSSTSSSTRPPTTISKSPTTSSTTPTRPPTTKMVPKEQTTITLKERVVSAMSLIDLFQNMIKTQQGFPPTQQNTFPEIPVLQHTVAHQRPMPMQEQQPYGFGHFDPQDVFLPWYFL